MLSLPVSPYSSPPTSAHASPSREPGEIEPATDPEKVPSSNEAKEEVSKLMKMLKFLLGIGLQSFDQVIDWLESTSADYRDVVNRIKSAEERGEVHHSPSSDEPSSPRETESTDESGTGLITTVAEVHPHKRTRGRKAPSLICFPSLLPPAHLLQLVPRHRSTPSSLVSIPQLKKRKKLMMYRPSLKQPLNITQSVPSVYS